MKVATRLSGGRLQRFAASLPGESWLFVAASLVNSTGSALLWPLVTIYVHNVLHRSYEQAGIVLLFQSAASVIGQVSGGALYRRIGPRRLIVGSLFATGLAQWTLIIAHQWGPYLLMMTVNGFLIAITMPAVNALVGFRWPRHRYRLFNLMYVGNNLGVAVGTSLAGILAVISFNWTFAFDGATTLGFGVFLAWFLRRPGAPALENLAPGLTQTSRVRGVLQLLRDRRAWLLLALGSMMVWLATSSWNSGVAPFLNQSGHSPTAYSFLWTVNGVVIVAGQPLISLLNRTLARTLYSRLVGGALLYALAFAFLFVMHGYYVDFLCGMVIATFGEMWLSPTIPALITTSTGQDAPFYLGLVGGVGSGGRLVGPPLFGGLFDSFGVVPILAAATVSSVTGAGLLWFHGRASSGTAKSVRRQTQPHTPAQTDQG